jgi:hypothetical protein
MDDTEPLFNVYPGRRHRGRNRMALDTEVKTARDADSTLSPAGVANLRTLADAIDALEHRAPLKPYELMVLSALTKQFGETYDRVFAAVAHDADPLTRALAEFAATETRDPQGQRAD